MSPSEWQRIRDLFDKALTRPYPQRAAFLDQALNDEHSDPTAVRLRAEVDALLEAHDQVEADDALRSPFPLFPDTAHVTEGSSSDGAASRPLDAHPPKVGPYRLVRPLGRGGMGTVYLAERQDGQFHQTVALKLIRRGLDTDDVLARFSFERQILARLDHPNIARLYDGGVTEDGRPYFAMEYVDGEPITDYCDRRRLSIPDRLALFRVVCAAVQHAHRNLVVHRDLKPSNIYVTDGADTKENGDDAGKGAADEPADGATGEPHVKLLDFGIAKLLADDAFGTHLAVPRTRTGSALLTPEYAAPEQVRGDAVTTATDVYQLGLLLYELLTGHLPYQPDRRVPSEIARVILEEHPPRPSSVVGKAPRGRTARHTAIRASGGALQTAASETAAHRATTPRRLQRRLAGDLDVICLKALKKDPTRRYADVDALAEDVQRHRTGRPVRARPDTFAYRTSRFVRRHAVAVGAAVAVLLAVLGGAGAALWQSRIAAVERDRAEEARVQAEGTLAFLEDVIASGGPGEGDPETPIGMVLDSAAARVDDDLADQPRVARAVYTSLAGVFFEMGRLDAAEQAARAALARYGPRDRTTRNSKTRDNTTRDAGYGRTAHVLGMILDYQDAHEASLQYHEDALAHLPDAPGTRALRAAALNTYAAVLLDVRREEDAERAMKESLALYRTLDDPDVLYPLSGLGVLHTYQGRFTDALPLLREVVERLQVRHGGPHYELGEALGNLAGALAELDRVAEALPIRQDAVQMLRETVGPEHHSTIISQAAYTNELLQVGEVARAQQTAQQALAGAQAAFGPTHSLTAYAQNVAGQAYCSGDDPARGASLLQQSLTTRRDLLPDGHWLTANGESLLGDCLARTGRRDEAAALLQRGYDGLLDARGADHVKTQEARARLLAFRGE